MTTFNEWVDNQPSLFTAIQQHHEFEFITLLGIDKLDMFYKTQYGNRGLPNYLTNLTTMELANMLVIAYYSKWEQGYKFFNHQFEIGVSSIETLSTETNDTTERDMVSGTTNKVSAFNDDSLTDDNSSEETLSDDTSKKVLTTTEKKIENYDIIEKQMKLFNSGFILDVFKDILKYSSLSIY